MLCAFVGSLKLLLVSKIIIKELHTVLFNLISKWGNNGVKYRYRPFCRIFCYTRNSQKPAITFLLCAYQMTFQRGAYPGRYACNNRTTLAYSWLDSRQNFNFASFPPRYSRTSTYDNCAHDSVYVRKPVLMDYKLLPYSPIQANVSFAYMGFIYSWPFIFQRSWGEGGSPGRV